MISDLILIVLLLLMALQDIRRYSLQGDTLLIYSLTGLITAGIRYYTCGEISWIDAAALGLLLILLGRYSRGSVGMGDLWAIAGLPLFLQGAQMWEGLVHSTLLMLPVSLAVYRTERDRKAVLPYIPFLCAGIILVIGRKMLNGSYQ